MIAKYRRSKGAPMFLKYITGFDVQYFIPNSLIASFLRSYCSTFVFVKGRGTCGSGKRNVKIWIDFRKFPRFSLTSPLSQEREKSSHPVFTICGEPWVVKVFTVKVIVLSTNTDIKTQYHLNLNICIVQL